LKTTASSPPKTTMMRVSLSIFFDVYDQGLGRWMSSDRGNRGELAYEPSTFINLYSI
jgi:hypothetical protein